MSLIGKIVGLNGASVPGWFFSPLFNKIIEIICVGTCGGYFRLV